MTSSLSKQIVDSYSFLSHLYSFFSFSLVFPKALRTSPPSHPNTFSNCNPNLNLLFFILSNLFPLKPAFPPVLTISTNATTTFLVVPYTCDLILSFEFSISRLLQGPVVSASYIHFHYHYSNSGTCSHHLDHYVSPN